MRAALLKCNFVTERNEPSLSQVVRLRTGEVRVGINFLLRWLLAEA